MDINRRNGIKRALAGAGVGAIMLSGIKNAAAETIVTDEYVSVGGKRFTDAATVVVGRSGNVDYLCDGVADDVQIQAAIDGINAGESILSRGDLSFDSPILITKPLTWIHFGDITCAAGFVEIGDGSSSVEVGVLSICGSITGPLGTDSCIKMISGRYWDMSIRKINNFDIAWEFAPIAQVSSVWYAGNILATEAWPATHVWYIPAEPSNVYIEGNILKTSGLCHAEKPILIEGGLGNALYGFTHSKAIASTPDIDDSASRGSNLFIALYTYYSSAINLHENSILISPKRTILPSLEYKRYTNNLLPNGGFEKWNGNTPVGFSSSGTVTDETGIVKRGYHSAKLVSGDGVAGFIYYTIPPALRSYLEGRNVTLTSWVYCTDTTRARAGIYYNDGALVQTFSDYHTGSGWEKLSVSVKLGTGLVDLFIRPVTIDTGVSITVYTDASMFAEKIDDIDYSPGPGEIPIGYQAAGALTPPSIPASTTAYTNSYGYPCMVSVYGGTVTAIAVDGVATGQTSGVFTIPPGKTITLTYSVAPTWRWFGL